MNLFVAPHTLYASLWLLLVTLCTPAEVYAVKDPDWWKHTVIYQVYPISFQDSDGNGIGDIKGILSRIDYLQWLGVGTVWLSPVYVSPMVDAGYDVADYTNIDPVFGTMGDFEALLTALHDRGMYLLMDLIPNHTSLQHAWFRESRRGPDNPYSDYYVWSPGRVLANGTRVPPNNWLSRFDGPAWEWDESRREYYLHQYYKQQPELNYRNPRVRAEIQDVFRFWLEKGVDGFRIDAIKSLFEVEDLSLDEPRTYKEGILPHEAWYLDHIHTVHQPELHDVIRGWRAVLDQHEAGTGHHPLLVMEANDRTMLHAIQYYHSGADFAFNFNLVTINASVPCGGSCVRQLVDSWLQLVPKGKWPNYVLGSHDEPRIADRTSPGHVAAANLLLLTLPGTPTCYYGDEIGVRNVALTTENNKDPLGVIRGVNKSRDLPRGPMQWSNTTNAGFSSSNKTWLPVHADYPTRNVKTFLDDESSPLFAFRRAARLRKASPFRTTNIKHVTTNDNIISYIRWHRSKAYLIALNVGHQKSNDDYITKFDGTLMTAGVVVMTTGQCGRGLHPGKEIPLWGITLAPGDGFVVRLHQRNREEL